MRNKLIYVVIYYCCGSIHTHTHTRTHTHTHTRTHTGFAVKDSKDQGLPSWTLVFNVQGVPSWTVRYAVMDFKVCRHGL